VEERPILHAISDKFAESPPIGIGVGETIEFRRHRTELQTEGVHQQLFPFAIGDEDSLRIVPARSGERESPGKQVV
jgi:hypothetical protein